MARDPIKAKEGRKKRYSARKEEELRSNKEWHKNNPEKSKVYYASRYERNKDKIRERQAKYYQANRAKIIARASEYSKEHKASKAEYDAQYREQNTVKLREVKREYKNRRLAIDPLFKLAGNISSLIRLSFIKNGYSKSSKTREILGCDYPFFKAYIEQRFLPGMSWENRSEWHLDHITPVASADTEKKLIKLNHYTNFRPLWAADNIRKGDKMNEQLTLLAA
jgi:hypothetical protein